MPRLLASISAREARGRAGRSALLLGAVATGVALIVAVGLINTSVLASFQRTFETAAGPADLEVTLSQPHARDGVVYIKGAVMGAIYSSHAGEHRHPAE